MTENRDNISKVDFDSIAAMMCGEELTDSQKKDVEQFNKEYEQEKLNKIVTVQEILENTYK